MIPKPQPTPRARQRIADHSAAWTRRTPWAPKIPIAALWLLLAAVGVGLQAQQPAAVERRAEPAVSYLFVSPNTREGLTLKEALANLDAPEESNLITQIREAGCRLGLRPVVFRAIGSWSDGAEHSTVSRTTTDAEALRYLSAWLGSRARQKTVLTFQRDQSGSARLYVLRTNGRRSLTATTRELDRDQINNRTIVLLRRQLRIYVVDLSGDLSQKMRTAARRLRGSLSATRGTANFTGDEHDRDQAQSVFRQEMSSYESSHPPLRNCSAIKP